MPTRCPECRLRRRSELYAKKAGRLTHPLCMDCGEPFDANKTAKIAARCSTCRVAYKKKMDSAYGKANREKHREANRRYRQKSQRPPEVTKHICPDCAGEYEKVHNGGKVPARCPVCSDAYRLDRVRLQTKQRRESKPEYFEEYRKNNSERLTAKALRWAKENPEKHKARGARYRSRKSSNEVEIFTRADIAERDGWICSICSESVDESLKFPHPMAGELEHVIPVTAPNYPGHTWGNVRLAHSRCNKKKGGFKRGT